MNDYITTEDGSRIAYRVDGQGPYLFLVGAPVGMAGFAQLAMQLRDRFRVVLHDPRGIGFSELGAGGKVGPEAFARDLDTLIRHLAGDNVLLFGASGGAITAFELLRQNGDLVDCLVAHEPPLFRLLPDGGRALATADAAFALAHDDPVAGMQAFVDFAEIFHSTYEEYPRPQPFPLPEPSADERAENRFFLTRMAGPTVHYLPDMASLVRKRPIIAAGEASIGQPARRAAIALCDVTGQPLVAAPGNHIALATMPAEFASWLTAVFDARGNGD